MQRAALSAGKPAGLLLRCLSYRINEMTFIVQPETQHIKIILEIISKGKHITLL